MWIGVKTSVSVNGEELIAKHRRENQQCMSQTPTYLKIKGQVLLCRGFLSTLHSAQL